MKRERLVKIKNLLALLFIISVFQIKADNINIRTQMQEERSIHRNIQRLLSIE
jgi:hypothetical protein